jgi:hypothetical protein
MTPDELASLNEIGHDIVEAFTAIVCETLLLSTKRRQRLESLSDHLQQLYTESSSSNLYCCAPLGSVVATNI